MKQYYLKVRTKNEKSLKNFLHFFFKHLKTKFNIIQKAILTKNSRKTITLLKSPHVNKTAQEHFEVRVFTRYLQIKSFSLKKNLIFLKQILNKLFQDISISLEFVIDKNENQKNKTAVFYPDSFKLFSNKPVKINLKRSKRKFKSQELFVKRNSLFNLMKFLTTISIFSEVLILSLKKS